jgi:DsbC/DsbD-like thiol-disulfide interchange protein
MSRRFAALGLLAVLGAAPAGARALDVVSVVPPSSVEVRPGAAARFPLQIVVKPGYHVQANPVENPSLIPITLKVDPGENVSVGEPLYPSPKRIRLPGDTQDLVVYDGTFVISLPVTAARRAASGATVTLRGTLRYQACDDSHCLFPVTLPVTLPVTVKER